MAHLMDSPISSGDSHLEKFDAYYGSSDLSIHGNLLPTPEDITIIPTTPVHQFQCPQLHLRTDIPAFKRNRARNFTTVEPRQHCGLRTLGTAHEEPRLPAFRGRVVSYHRGERVNTPTINYRSSVQHVRQRNTRNLYVPADQTPTNSATLGFAKPPAVAGRVLTDQLHSLWRQSGVATRHWKHDIESDKCDHQACRRTFNLINRKHHCRLCGYIFCGDCSKYTIQLLPNLKFCERNGIPSRACQSCYIRYKEATL